MNLNRLARGLVVTTAKEFALRARAEVLNARSDETCAEHSKFASALVHHAQFARLRYVEALISLVRFFDALPEPVAIPPVPQPSEEARRRGLLVGAIVRTARGGVRVPGFVVAHCPKGNPIVHWEGEGDCGWEDVDDLTLVRPAPFVREPNAEALRRGLYIGARVDTPNVCNAEIIAWDGDGNPVVEPDDDLDPIGSWPSGQVVLAGDAS